MKIVLACRKPWSLYFPGYFFKSGEFFTEKNVQPFKIHFTLDTILCHERYNIYYFANFNCENYEFYGFVFCVFFLDSEYDQYLENDEDSEEAKPEDENVIKALKVYYERLEMTEKLNQLNGGN